MQPCHDVCHVMLDEQDEFIQQVMANRDTAMAAIAELTTIWAQAKVLWWKERSMTQILSDPAGE
jgi:hypothetical protein